MFVELYFLSSSFLLLRLQKMRALALALFGILLLPLRPETNILFYMSDSFDMFGDVLSGDDHLQSLFSQLSEAQQKIRGAEAEMHEAEAQPKLQEGVDYAQEPELDLTQPSAKSAYELFARETFARVMQDADRVQPKQPQLTLYRRRVKPEVMSEKMRRLKGEMIELFNNQLIPYIEHMAEVQPEAYGPLADKINERMEMVNQNVLARERGERVPYPELEGENDDDYERAAEAIWRDKKRRGR